MAIKRWIGGAVAIADVWTITVAGTWASGDTVTISVGNKELVITLGASASTVVADIAAEIADAIMASDNTAPGTGFTWSHGGQQFREFTEFTAVANGAVVTVTGVTAGTPLGLVVTEVTAGDGTATESNTVAATGPYHLDNADNYLGGVLPVDNDVLYFDTGNVSALYGLTYFRANNIDLDVYITGDWTGQLGLGPIRSITAGDYAEFRQRYFQMRGGSKVLHVSPGVSGVTSQGRLYIDLQDQATCDVTIETGRGLMSSVPSIYLCGTTTATGIDVTIKAGCVSIEPDDAPTASGKEFIPGTLTIGTTGASANDCIVYIGKNADLHLGSSIFIDGGTVWINSATKNGADVCDVTATTGILYLNGAGDHNNIVIGQGATLYPTGPSGTIAALFVYGTYDSRRGGAIAVTTLKLYAGASFYNPGLNATIFEANLVGCTIQQLGAFVTPPNRQFDWIDVAVPS